MFKILPSKNIVFHSPLSAEICLQNLANKTEEKKAFKLDWKAPVYSKPYIGFVAGGEFEIHRNIAYRNSFLPIIRGKITSGTNGSTISINMRTDRFVSVFIAIWLGFTFLFCLILLFIAFKASFSPFFIIPFIMVIFGTVLSHGAFNYERKKSVEDLKGFFETV
jgi:hypothetical protein